MSKQRRASFDRPMFQLQRLKVHKCRSVLPGTELNFNGGINVLIGKTNTGKSTLLRLIASAIGSSFEDEFNGEELALEYECQVDAVMVRCKYRRELESIPGSGNWANAWWFNVELRHEKDVLIAEMHGNRLTLQIADRYYETEFNPIVGFMPSLDLVSALVSMFSKFDLPSEVLGPIVAPFDRMRLTHRFDESLDWLRATLRDFGLLFTPSPDERKWCNPNIRYSGIRDDLVASLQHLRGQFDGLPDVITLHSHALPFLQRICPYLEAEEITWTLAFREYERHRETKIYGHSQVFVTIAGSRLPVEKLSYGHQRLFAFFLHSAMHPHALVADELTNGMHHSMVEGSLEELGSRQAFLATQNPLLLDHLGFEGADEVQRTFVLCHREAQPNGERAATYRKMSLVEASEFYTHYKVGVLHVNEILRRRGLW